jgi:hypothetical protein
MIYDKHSDLTFTERIPGKVARLLHRGAKYSVVTTPGNDYCFQCCVQNGGFYPGVQAQVRGIGREENKS